MKECIYQSYRLEWRGIDIEIRYCREWLSSTDEYAVAHFEVESACRSPLPITETGFVSHFTDPLLVLELGGPAGFVESWLEAESKSSVWKNAEESLRQYSLL